MNGMPHARITDIAFRTPPLMSTADLAGLVAADTGGDAVARVIDSSAIATKGMEVDPRTDDPRRWSTRQRMDRSLT